MSIKSKIVEFKSRVDEFHDEHPVVYAIGVSAVKILTFGAGAFLGYKLKERMAIDHEILDEDDPYERDKIRVDRLIDQLETAPAHSALVLRNLGTINNDGQEVFKYYWYRNADVSEDSKYGARKSITIANNSFKSDKEESRTEQTS